MSFKLSPPPTSVLLHFTKETIYRNNHYPLLMCCIYEPCNKILCFIRLSADPCGPTLVSADSMLQGVKSKKEENSFISPTKVQDSPKNRKLSTMYHSYYVS